MRRSVEKIRSRRNSLVTGARNLPGAPGTERHRIGVRPGHRARRPGPRCHAFTGARSAGTQPPCRGKRRHRRPRAIRFRHAPRSAAGRAACTMLSPAFPGPSAMNTVADWRPDRLAVASWRCVAANEGQGPRLRAWRAGSSSGPGAGVGTDGSGGPWWTGRLRLSDERRTTAAPARSGPGPRPVQA